MVARRIMGMLSGDALCLSGELERLFVGIGWPTVSKVGHDASRHVASLVCQARSIGFQRWCLSMMKECPKGEVDSSDIRRLKDLCNG